MYGARALSISYDAFTARHEDLLRDAARHRRARSSAKPRPHDRIRKTHPVAKHRGLLRVAR